MEVDDPWDWSVDRVVQELCTDHRTWQSPASGPSLRPDPALLEKALREHEVTGYILLMDVDEMVMRNDLGIVLGRRPFLRNAIIELRRRSVQYQAPRYTAQSLSYNIPGQNEFAQLGPAFNQATSPIIQLPPNMTTAGAPHISAAPVNALEVTPSSYTPHTQSRTEGNDTTIDPPSSKRRKINADGHSIDVELQLESNNDDAPDYSDAQVGFLHPEASSLAQAAEVGRCTTVVVDGKERKRLAPTLITTEINPHRNRDIPTEADNVSHNSQHTVKPGMPDAEGKKRKRTNPSLVASEFDLNRNRDMPTEADSVILNRPQTVEPGVAYTDNDGRKRLIPIHQPDLDTSELTKSIDTVGKGVSKVRGSSAIAKPYRKQKKKARPDSIATGYLGKRKIHVDDIFYGGTALGEDLPTAGEDTEFSQGIVSISSGRRIYVHNIMKHFLRSERQDFVKDGHLLSAVLPYSIALTERFQSSSFTLFHPASDGTMLATRADVASWPEVDPEASVRQAEVMGGDNVAIFNLPGPEMLRGLGSYQDWDYSHLEKYRLLDGADEVLPLYGESDSENEYDEALWREIEDERGSKLERPVKASKKPPLSAADINVAIDEGISALVAKWKQKQLPKLQPKAYRIWQKSRKTGTWKLDMETAQERLSHISQRLARMRSEILRDVWTNAKQVRRQTTIMDQTVVERQELRWKIAVLERKRPPEKPPQLVPVSKPQKRNYQTRKIEGESVESDTDISSSDDDLDGFIVDDPITSEEELELNLADTELFCDDSTSSDASFLDDPAKATKSTQDRSRLVFPSSERGLVNVQTTRCSSPRGRLILDQILPIHPRPPMGNPSDVVDLTLISSDDVPGAINPTTPRKRKKPLVRLYYNKRPITISDEDNTGLQGSEDQPLSPLTNPAEIAEHPSRTWEARSDRKNLLISILYKMDDVSRDRIFESITNISEDSLWSHLEEVMDALRSMKTRVKGMDKPTFETMTILLRLFEIFVNCKSYPYREPPDKAIINKLKNHRLESFSPFYKLCCQILDQFGSVHNKQTDDFEDGEPLGSVRRRHSNGTATPDDDSLIPNEAPRKTKRKLFEDAEARDLREQDRRRLAEQEQRRKRLHAGMTKSGHAGNNEDGRVIINDAKADNQSYILVHPQISRRIKKHQVEGVRFMWNQIVADENSLQGCLLAHTMGLGKTMQVITLLVAITEASTSDDPTILSQIPKRLRQSRTIVLCPPGLIDNWMDELLTWAPPGLLGRLLKVDSATKVGTRLPTIGTWHKDGGVLIIGYEMFRGIIKNHKKLLGDEDHERVCRQLLETPNIIIADEAHKLKNANTTLTWAASQFKSKSRIALTGSPLANNVEEYHTMIDWVAPNYLGPIREFRQKYAAPIHDGLWQDSNPYERKYGLKMLGVLKEDIAPKVHRADISVLRNDLPPKKEFIITVPLKELQRKAYALYVRSMESSKGHALTKDGEVRQSTLWHWLAILSLLCNHPNCFSAKLNERKADAKKEAPGIGGMLTATEPDDEGDDVSNEVDIANELNKPVWKVGVSQELINAEKVLFDEEGNGDMTSPELSNKVKILLQILDAAKAVQDKVLVFSQSIPTLDFLEDLCQSGGRKYSRLDGKTVMNKRQALTKAFNRGDTELYLISTSAGGLGLNLPGANRVVIFDFKFNPIMEEQAVGRAYRIGQKKPTFVYRFVAGGTFEDTVHNKTIFKMQLASRVVDKKSPVAHAKKKISDFLFEPRDVEQKDLSEFRGMDPDVLDKILLSQDENRSISSIVQTDTFERDDNYKFSPEEAKEVQLLVSEEKLKRTDPKAYRNRYLTQRNSYTAPGWSAGQGPHGESHEARDWPVEQGPATYNGGMGNRPSSSFPPVAHQPHPADMTQLTPTLHNTSPNNPSTPNSLARPGYGYGPGHDTKAQTRSNRNRMEGSNGEITKVYNPSNLSPSTIPPHPHLHYGALSQVGQVSGPNVKAASSAQYAFQQYAAEKQRERRRAMQTKLFDHGINFTTEVEARYKALESTPFDARVSLYHLARATDLHFHAATDLYKEGRFDESKVAHAKCLEAKHALDALVSETVGKILYRNATGEQPTQANLSSRVSVQPLHLQLRRVISASNGDHPMPDASGTPSADSAAPLEASSEDQPMPDASDTPSSTISSDNSARREYSFKRDALQFFNGSAPYMAMNKKPVPSLRTPVTKRTNAEVDAREARRLAELRRARAVNNQSKRSPSTTPTLPKWARDELSSSRSSASKRPL